MDKLPLVSVIVPVFNTEKYLAEALSSILDQSYTHWELIIVDDHSEDQSAGIAKGFCQKFPEKIRYYLNEGKGACTARNLGLEKSTGVYIKFMDADDALFDQEVLLSQIGFLEKGNFDIVYGNEWFYQKSFTQDNIIKKRGGAILSDKPNTFYRHFPITTNFLLKKESLGSVRWNAELKLGQEYFLLFQLFNRGKLFGYQGLDVAKIRVHNSVHRISTRSKKETASQTADLAALMVQDVKAMNIQDSLFLAEFNKALLFSSFGAMRANNSKAAKVVQALLLKNTDLSQLKLKLRLLFILNAAFPYLAYLVFRGFTLGGRKID